MSVKLPPPPSTYDPNYEAQRNRLIELFSNNVYEKGQDVGIYAPAKLIYNGRYGQFKKTTSVSPAAANTAYAITFDTSTGSTTNGVSIGSPASRIVVAEDGVYNFSAHFTVLSNTITAKTAYFWFRQNGRDVSASAFLTTSDILGGHMASGRDHFFPLVAGDYIELMWAADSTNLELHASPATAFAPSGPSCLLSVMQVQQ
jgi:hypothetical protein